MNGVTTPREAARRVAEVERILSTQALHLACHAALPVAVNPDLVNLLRINFFLDPPEELPYAVEAKLLLSPLFQEIDDGLYGIDRPVRDLLLLTLEQRYGPERVRQVATLLAQYTERSAPWTDRPELERAQQLTALSFLDPAGAAQWLEQATRSTGGEQLRPEWFIAMKRRLERPRLDSALLDERFRSAREQLETDAENLNIRLRGIRILEDLALYEGADRAGIVDLLVSHVRRRAPGPPLGAADGTVPTSLAARAPDVQTAMTVLGGLRHDAASRAHMRLNALDLRAADLAQADLGQADLNGASLQGADLRGANLTRADLHAANLADADLRQASAADANLEEARLVGARLTATSLANANLNRADLTAADLRLADLRGAQLSGSDLRNAKFDETQLQLAVADTRTLWPTGMDWLSAGVLLQEASPASPAPGGAAAMPTRAQRQLLLPSAIFVDRDEELRLFRSLFSGQDTRHILLIEAQQGMGKSALMEQFYSASAAFPRALVDLRPQAFTPVEVLAELASGLETTIADLGHAPKHVSAFPRYADQRERLAQAGYTDIQNARLSNVTHTTDSAMPRAEQAALQMITDLFFYDLDVIIQRYRRVVLLIDTFEKANIAVRQWVTGLFVNRIRGRLGVMAILAGRAIPKPWPFATTRQLSPLDLPYVREYLSRAELRLSEEEVRVLYEATDGIPLDLKINVARLLLKRTWSRG